MTLDDMRPYLAAQNAGNQLPRHPEAIRQRLLSNATSGIVGHVPGVLTHPRGPFTAQYTAVL